MKIIEIECLVGTDQKKLFANFPVFRLIFRNCEFSSQNFRFNIIRPPKLEIGKRFFEEIGKRDCNIRPNCDIFLQCNLSFLTALCLQLHVIFDDITVMLQFEQLLDFSVDSVTCQVALTTDFFGQFFNG